MLFLFIYYTFLYTKMLLISRFNPKATRQLKVDLVHTLDHQSVVCCVNFSADGRYLAAGCNRATYIYDVATSQRVA
jgi:glucose repression regulatory protein TUP1